MEVKIGYKQTEIGIIPYDWEVKTVNELIDLLTDYDANGSFSSVAENVRVYDYQHFAWYVRSTDLENNTNITNVRYVDEPSYNFLKKTALYGGELLFLKRGDIGRIYLFEAKTKYATVAPNLYLLKLNKAINSRYLFYFFNTKIGQQQLKSKNASSTLGALYKDDVKSILVATPTLKEQTAIANALSDTDSWINSLEQLLTKKRQIKQGAMQELLQPKEDWEVKKLGDLFNITAGGDLDVGKFSLIQDEKYCFPIYSNALTNKGLYGFSLEYKQNENTITVTARGQVGVANPRNHKYVAIGRVLMLNPITKLDINFISEFINNYVQFSNESTGVPQLTAPQISNYEVILPIAEEQTRIASILSDMDDEIAQLETKLAKAKQIKQGMMQELLTGRIRLV